MMRSLFSGLLVCVALAATDVFGAEQKYNVLFIAVDDLRPELGSYGNPIVKTPHIDKLATQSIQFDRAYCQFALCNPSRASLLSGRRPETIKVYELGTFLRKHNPGMVTLPQLFKDNGYQALCFGKIFHFGNGNHEDHASWSERAWHSPPDDPAESRKKLSEEPKAPKVEADPDTDIHANELPYGAPVVADDALIDGQIAQHAVAALRRVKDKPFFLAVGFHRPHLPFVAPKKYWDLYDGKKMPVASNTFLPKDAPAFASNDASELRRYKDVPKKGEIPDALARRLVHGYYASVSYMDAQVGAVLAELDQLGLREKTVVVLWGDHGYQLGEHGTWTKRTNWEIATRVPLLLSAPRQKTAGEKTRALVELVDLYPTLAELCKLPAPDGLEGTSLVPLLDDAKLSPKNAAFSLYVKKVPELGEGNCFGRAMRTDRYRFIEWSVAGNAKSIVELYDEKKDPRENVNIANLPENKALVESLQQQLKAGWKGARPASSSQASAK